LDILFNVKGKGEKTDSLFCEWGQGFCCIAGYNESQQSVTGLKYLSFDEPVKDNAVSYIVNEIRNSVRNKIIFSFAFPEQVFIPRKLRENEFVNSIYGRTNVFNDHIAEWQLTNQYSIPEKIDFAIKQNFTSAEIFNVHTAWLKNNTGFDASEQIILDITPKDFRVLVKQSGKLLLAQLYNYTSPLDVVYYLLKIVSVFQLAKEDVFLIISGLVEENSALYRELNQYFNNLHFSKTTALHFEHDYPAHYFTTVLNLAACVS
jgi:hypothetical protein